MKMTNFQIKNLKKKRKVLILKAVKKKKLAIIMKNMILKK
jgi:hypothetical protein